VADFSGLGEISGQNKADIPEGLIGVLFGLIASPSIRLLADNCLVFSIAITASVQQATALSIALLAYCVGIGQSMLFNYPNGALILGAMALFAIAWTCSLPRPSLLAGLAGSEATSP